MAKPSDDGIRVFARCAFKQFVDVGASVQQFVGYAQRRHEHQALVPDRPVLTHKRFKLAHQVLGDVLQALDFAFRAIEAVATAVKIDCNLSHAAVGDALPPSRSNAAH